MVSSLDPLTDCFGDYKYVVCKHSDHKLFTHVRAVYFIIDKKYGLASAIPELEGELLIEKGKVNDLESAIEVFAHYLSFSPQSNHDENGRFWLLLQSQLQSRFHDDG